MEMPNALVGNGGTIETQNLKFIEPFKSHAALIGDLGIGQVEALESAKVCILRQMSHSAVVKRRVVQT